MATLGKEPNGWPRLQYKATDGKRATLRLGKMSRREAESMKRHVEDLIVLHSTRGAMPMDLTRWVAELKDSLHARLVQHGYLAERAVVTLAELCQAFLSHKEGKVGDRTFIYYTQACERLRGFFGDDKRVIDLTPLDASEFRHDLSCLPPKRGGLPGQDTLADATVSHITQKCRTLFNFATSNGWLAKSPFRHETRGDETNSSRHHEVPLATIKKVLEEIADPEFRAIVILARFGGLRCPSETEAMQWQDVNFERLCLTVYSEKTKPRIVPMYPEVRVALEALFDPARGGATLVFPHHPGHLYSKLRAATLRAGIVPWPKQWQNMRLTREGELYSRFPLPTVAKWQGHSPAIALKHYNNTPAVEFALAVSDVAFDQATNAAVTCPHCGGEVSVQRGGADVQSEMKSDVNSDVSMSPADAHGRQWRA